MKNKTNKILITGSSGTIGTRLFEKLLEHNHNVIGFDRNPNKWSSKLNKLTIIGDLLKKDDVENILSTYNVLDFCRLNNIEKVIFSSSRESYGNRKKMVAKETDVDIRLCESAYAASKISDEVLVYSFSKCYAIDYVVCRFSNVYGMYDESERFIQLLIKKMRKNEDVEIFGKDKILDFTYIDDCVEGVVKCIEKFDKVKNDTFNIAFSKGSNLVDVARHIKKNLNSKSRILIGKNRPGEVVKYIADISKAKKVLGYEPRYPLLAGLKLAINWYQNNLP